MSKWALFSAHRYVRWGSGARTVGADGRLLAKPWRVRSLAAQREAQNRRAARAQPFWPRPLGWMLIGIAVLAVIDADYPIPTHVEASSAVSGPRLMLPVAQKPCGPGEGVPLEFRWDELDVPPPFRVFVHDEDYDELARIDDIGTAFCPVTGTLATRLAEGGVFHWCVEGDVAGRPVRSALQTFEIR
jgi:hypothetical protein